MEEEKKEEAATTKPRLDLSVGGKAPKGPARVMLQTPVPMEVHEILTQLGEAEGISEAVVIRRILKYALEEQLGIKLSPQASEYMLLRRNLGGRRKRKPR